MLIIDLRYADDARTRDNRAALDRLVTDELAAGVIAYTLWEVVGILSFGTPDHDVPDLPKRLLDRYSLRLIPDDLDHDLLTKGGRSDLLLRMKKGMAVGDAIQAAEIAEHAPDADCLLTWNSKHFVGELPVPVLTPREWLDGRA